MSAPADTTTRPDGSAGAGPAAGAAAGSDPAPDVAPPAEAGASAPGGGDGAQAAAGDGQPGGGDRSGDGPDESKDAREPGSESDRYAFRRENQQFLGDHVAQNKFVFYLSDGAPSAPPRQLSAALEDLARFGFVAPDGWDECRVAFRERGAVVLLRGGRGQGRTTMAVRLLQTVEARAILLLDPATDLARVADQITDQRVQPGTAFLLTDPHHVDQLDAYTVESVAAALDASNSRLVLTVGAEIAFRDRDVLRYELGVPAAPPRREILARHLSHLTGEERAEYLLAQSAVAELVSAQLAGDEVSCERVAFIAWLLSRAPDPVDVDHLAARLRRRSVDEFDIWFETLESPELRCFAVALAVLHGLPFEEVARAARLLHQRLNTGGALVVAEDFSLRVADPDPFRLDQATLTSRLEAQIETAPFLTPSGRLPGSRIGYRDASYRQQVIDRAMGTYLLGDHVLEWLSEIIPSGSMPVAVCAGGALGMMVRSGFDHLRRQVLVPWAYHGDLWRNCAVADALRVVAADPRLRPAVRRLVDGWYRSGNPDAQCTAALALGTGLGEPDPARCLAALERLAMVDHLAVRVGIARGFASLLAEDPQQLAAGFYEVVRRCLADRRRRTTGWYAFLFVAGDLATDVTVPGRDPVRWPTLLHLAQANAELRAPLFDRWCQVLAEGRAMPQAEHVLRGWAGHAEADEGMRAALARMVRAVARRDARAGTVLARMARQWDSDEELVPLPGAAQTVLSVVSY